MAEQNDENVEITTPAGSLKVRGTDIVGILTLIATVCVGVFMWGHTNDSSSKTDKFIAVLNEMKEGQKEAGKQQRLMTCILSRSEKERVREFESPNSFCQQISK